MEDVRKTRLGGVQMFSVECLRPQPTEAAVYMAVWFFLMGPRSCRGAEILDNLMQIYRASVVEGSRRKNFQEDRVWRGWNRH